MRRTPDLIALALACAARACGDAIVVEPPGSDLAARLSAVIGPPRVFAHPPVASARHDAPLIVLGAADRDRVSARPLLWPGGTLSALVRERRIDTLYQDRPIVLLVLGDAASAAAVLEGARETIASRRLAILFDLRDLAAPDAARLLSEARAALPAYHWPRLDAAMPPGQSLPPIAPAPRRTVVVVALDADCAAIGLHPPEPGAPEGGRWTGADLTTAVLLPRPPPGRWNLRLDIVDWGNAEQGFEVALDAVRLAPRHLAADYAEYGPFTLAPGGAVLPVMLFPPRPIPDLDRWPRKIGLRLSRVVLRPDTHGGSRVLPSFPARLPLP